MYDKIKLPYSYDALEPYIDAETVNIHYNKHLQTYVNNLNKILEGYDELVCKYTLKELLYNIDKVPKKIRKDVINQGGGVYNHNLYFSILSPNPIKTPKGKLLNEINNAFGNLDRLKKNLTEASIKQFGSGYGCLVKDRHGKLMVIQTPNQNCPLNEKLIPILMIDVWVTKLLQQILKNYTNVYRSIDL